MTAHELTARELTASRQPEGELRTAEVPADQGAPPDGAARLLRGLRPDGAALTLAEHLALHGALPLRGADLLEVAEASGLLGRGGARFPFGTKLRAVRDAGSALRRPVLVVNAAESEPASRKDAVLMTRTPHLVLDGAVLAALAVGAKEAVVWLHRGRPAVLRAVEAALAERRAAGLPGPSFRVVEGPPRYVGGESTAVVAHLSGRDARPITAPPLIARKGVGGKPTLLSNAETFAHLAVLVRRGTSWFRSAGTNAEPGTMLITVVGAVAVPCVVEAPVGTALGELVTASGGFAGTPTALLVGGYAGSWLPADRLDLAYSRAGLLPAGADPGVGMLVVLPAGACPVHETARLAAWLADERVGQCGPCLNGLPALAQSARALAYGGGDATSLAAPDQLRRWAGMVEGRGACHHPDGVVRLVRTLLLAFPGEVARHAAGRACADAQPAIVLPGRGDGSWR